MVASTMFQGWHVSHCNRRFDTLMLHRNRDSREKREKNRLKLNDDAHSEGTSAICTAFVGFCRPWAERPSHFQMIDQTEYTLHSSFSMEQAHVDVVSRFSHAYALVLTLNSLLVDNLLDFERNEENVLAWQ